LKGSSSPAATGAAVFLYGLAREQPNTPRRLHRDRDAALPGCDTDRFWRQIEEPRRIGGLQELLSHFGALPS